MPSTTWKSPFGGPQQIHGPKRFAIQMSWEGITPGLCLDMAAGALARIDSGQLWKHDGRLVPMPEAGPGSVQLTANAAYSSQGGRGKVSMDMLAQPHMHAPNTLALLLTFYDEGPSSGFGLAWTEQVSEAIVATTTLHVGVSIMIARGWNQPEESPIGQWTWVMGAWMSTRDIQYNDWTIRLQR